MIIPKRLKKFRAKILSQHKNLYHTFLFIMIFAVYLFLHDIWPLFVFWLGNVIMKSKRGV